MAFSNPLTFANIVSAQQFELLDANGTPVVTFLSGAPGQGNLVGPGGTGNRGSVGIAGDGTTYSNVVLGAGNTFTESATVSVTQTIGLTGTVNLEARAGGIVGAAIDLNGSGGTVAVTTTAGITLNTRPTRQNIAFGEAASTANLALGAADVAIPGATVTHTLNAGDLVVVTGYYDLGNAGVASTAWGTLYVNGALAFGGRGPGHTIGAGGRSTVSHQWQYTAPSAGAYSFVLRGRQTGGTWTAYQPFGAGGCYISTAVYATV